LNDYEAHLSNKVQFLLDAVLGFITIEQNDLFKANIRDATVVTLFLLQKVNLRLRPKLLKELTPGTRIVSNTFDMGDWKPDKEETLATGDAGHGLGLSRQLFLWIIPQRR